MNKVEVNDTKLTVLDLAELAKQGPVVLTRRGKPLATLRPLKNGDWESTALAANPKFVALIEDARRSYAKEGGKSLEEVRRELGLPDKSGPRTKSRGR